MTRAGVGRPLLLAALLVMVDVPRLAHGHGSVVVPPPRNAIDADLPPWNGPVPATNFDPFCAVPSSTVPPDRMGRRLSGKNGQACFWFSAGCSIFCDECDGITRGPIPNVPCRPDAPEEMCRRKMPVCNMSAAKQKHPTLPREARTVNVGVEDGAHEDWYMYSPWRAPGSAAVVDPCGVAGGTHLASGQPTPFGVNYKPTPHAKAGDRGSEMLKVRNTGTTWTAGDVVEVSWSINANHGGGYYYRLCKLPEDGSPVTEACFQETPLQFVGNTRFRWNGDPSTEEEILNTVLVSTGTTPAGSTWAMNPVPRNDTAQTGASFEPRCNETCSGCGPGGTKAQGRCATCRCTGEFPNPNLEIVDHVALPWMLPPGQYVLGWRWDAEESNQVWNSCSDVEVKAHPAAVSQQIPCPSHLASRGLCLGDSKMSQHENRSAALQAANKGRYLDLNKTMTYVRNLLQQAIMVEHGTIPLYLSSIFSVPLDINGSAYARSVMHSVVIEEMTHMATVANVLNAVGGAPLIDAPGFIPEYPLTLPLTGVPASIQPFSKTSVENFMLIESTTEIKKSIGSAYEYILSMLQALVEAHGEAAVFTGNPALQVSAAAPNITGMADTITALLGVAEQGGGCPMAGEEELWPNVVDIGAGPAEGGNLSHYARFAAIHAGKEWQAGDNIKTGPTGAALETDWDKVYTFAPNPKLADLPAGSKAHAMARAFAGNYTALLVQLHNVFNGAPGSYWATLGAMHALPDMAIALMTTPDPRAQAGGRATDTEVEAAADGRKGTPTPTLGLGVGPTWEYVAAASEFQARGGRARPIVRTGRRARR